MSSLPLRSILVTGGTGGIGGQLTRSLCEAGFLVFFVGRDPTRGQGLEQQLRQAGRHAQFVQGDLSSQAGVVRVAETVQTLVQARGDRSLFGLVNNFGGVYSTPRTTVDGVEATFAHNFLHGLLLACWLLPNLEAGQGRVVQMSTGYHHLVRVTRADLTGRRWDCGMNVYGRAKLLSVQVGDVIGDRWQARGVGWHFADPGMAETPLTRSMGAADFPWYGRFLVPVVKQVQHPIPLRWCATSTLRLLARADLPKPTGVYVLPGPLVLPRPLVGFDRRAGEEGLGFIDRWLRPEYRSVVANAIKA